MEKSKDNSVPSLLGFLSFSVLDKIKRSRIDSLWLSFTDVDDVSKVEIIRRCGGQAGGA